MPMIIFFFFFEILAFESKSSGEAEEKEGEMRKANTPPAQDIWDWAQTAHPLSLPALETHTDVWDGPVCGPGPAQPWGLLCKHWGGGRRRFLLPQPLQPQKPPSPRCVRNCLGAGASCRCPALMNHTLSGLGVPNGWVTAEMPGDPCPGMHPPPHHTIPARRGLSRH